MVGTKQTFLTYPANGITPLSQKGLSLTNSSYHTGILQNIKGIYMLQTVTFISELFVHQHRIYDHLW
jgi:hypothetical protein